MSEHDCFDDHDLDECCSQCEDACDEAFWESYGDNQYVDVDFGYDDE